MASIREINVGGTLHDVKSTHYATCGTAAATAAKVATIQNGAFTLETGVKVSVKFTYANSAASATLNVNSTGAKTIQFAGAALASTQYWVANQVVDFVYDGTYWAISGVVKDNDTTNAGTITGVTAGNGLTGGGTSGSVTLNVGAGTGISVAADAISLATSGVTAGSYGPTANVTGSNNATINVPQITVDTYGRVTSVTNRVYTSVNTDTNTNVTQAAAITTNGNYPLLLGYSTATTAVTNTVNKTTTLNYNPSTKALTTGNIVLSSGYGTTLPSSGVEGQIFFLVVD